MSLVSSLLPQGPLSAAERASRSVFVGNIPYEATEETLKDIFSQVGPVVSFRLVYDRETGKPKGYGFCEYQDVETAQSAMRNLNNYDFHGRPLRVGVAAGENSQEQLRISGALGGPIIESPFGDDVEPEKAPEAITKAVASLPPEQMYELMKQMKVCVQNNPNEARNMLLQNPQLAYALLQAQIVMKIVDPQVALAMLYRQSEQIPPLLPSGDGDQKRPMDVDHRVGAPSTSNASEFPIDNGRGGPSSGRPNIARGGPSMGGPGPNSRMDMGGPRPRMDMDMRGGDRGYMGDPRDMGSRGPPAREMGGPMRPQRPDVMDPRDRDPRRGDPRLDSRGGLDPRSGGMDPRGGGMDPRGGGMDPRGGGMDPRGGGMDPRGGGMDPRGGGMDPRGGGMDPRGGGMDPRGGGMDPRGGGMDPRGGRMDPRGDGIDPRGGGMPSRSSAGGPSGGGRPATSEAQGQDSEKAALIMQVLQLTDQQIAMLPHDQRQSILVLKEQIARSGGPPR